MLCVVVWVLKGSDVVQSVLEPLMLLPPPASGAEVLGTKYKVSHTHPNSTSELCTQPLIIFQTEFVMVYQESLIENTWQMQGTEPS